MMNIVYSADSDLVNLTNQTYTIIETGVSGNDTNFTTYDYLNVELSVNYTSNNTNLTNNEVWYQWFLDGLNVVKGWGVNVITFFFGTEDLGNHLIQVNASSSENGTNNIWSDTLSWNVTIVQPTLEPQTLTPIENTEVYDSINIYCRHEYTGHTWFYDVDVKVKLNSTTYAWLNATDSPTLSEWNSFDLSQYVDDLNYSIRCRTYNEYFNYSNYTQVDNIQRKSLNQLKLFRPMMSSIFNGQLVVFESDCDMSKNNKYIILDHFADANTDGTYDKLMEYSNTSLTNRSVFWFNTKFIITGTQLVTIGCIVQKQTNDAWEFSSCKETEQTCTIQNTYEIEVLS